MGKSIINNQAISYLTTLDSRYQDIIDLYGLPPSWSRPEGFETLCQIILEQQVSLESGKAAHQKLDGLVSTFVPHEISKLTVAEMRAATISRQKSGYILGLAQLILNGQLDLKSLRNNSAVEVLKVLTKVKGIGPWTAEVYMLFALQNPDIYPMGDIALINTIKELWMVKSAQEALMISAEWSPHRSTASFLLWHYYLSSRGRVATM